MAEGRLSIGQASLRTGISVKTLLQDTDFIATMRALSLASWQPGFDAIAYQRASTEAAEAAKAAIAAGEAPEGERARGILERLLEASAAAYGKPNDAAFREEFQRRFREHDPRASRLWELSAILNGRDGTPQRWHWIEEWKWLSAAAVHHLAG